jgi:hypothetical protein
VDTTILIADDHPLFRAPHDVNALAKRAYAIAQEQNGEPHNENGGGLQ